MDINCERCGTEHEIDETQLPETAVSVRCSSCTHVFSVQRPPDDGFRILRDASPLATCPDLATVQRWVAEGRLLRSDELDANGVRTRMGEVPELQSFFAAVDAALKAGQTGQAAAPSLAAPLFASTNPSFPMPDFSASKKSPDASETEAESPPTLRYSAAKEAETSDQAVTEMALPALKLPAAPGGSSAMAFATAPVDQPEKTPEQRRGALPQGGAAASRFAVSPSPLSNQTVVEVRAISKPSEPEPSAPSSTAAAEATKVQGGSQAADVAAYTKASSPAAPTLSDDEDPEILAFKQRGQGQRRAFFVLLLLVLIGGVGWFFVKPLLDETPPVDEGTTSTIEKKAGAEDTKGAKDTTGAQTAKAEPEEAEEADEDTQPSEADSPPPTHQPATKKARAETTGRTKARKGAPAKGVTKTAMAPAGAFDSLPPPPQGVGVNIDAFMKSGNEWLRKGDTKKAHASFDQAVSARPSHVEAVFLRGVARFDLGRTDEAIADLKRALELSPRFSDAMIVLAEAFKTKKDTKNACFWYQNYYNTAGPNGADAPTARANLARLRCL